MTLRALYVDFNSYFASVEQQLRPELRGKPVGVLPVMAETTSCIAASVEAKRYGVRTGTSVREARRLCRDIVLVESRPAVYIEMHHKLVEAVESCLHVEKVFSIDEMWCRLQGRDASPENALWLAQDIKLAIYRSVGTEMRCSIGIAPNRFLAKVASDMQKPNGLVMLQQSDLPQRLFKLGLRDLQGIGRSTERRLHEFGFTTVEQLCAASAWELRKVWRGIAGERFHAALHGADIAEMETERRSVSHSHVLPPEWRNPLDAYAVLHRLLQKAAARLRHEQCLASHLTVYVKLIDRKRQTMRWQPDSWFMPTADTRTLTEALVQIWEAYPFETESEGWMPLAVGVALGGLSDKLGQNGMLFDESDKASDQLNTAIDSLNRRFGRKSLYYGGAATALSSAPMRIAFTHVPDQSVESD